MTLQDYYNLSIEEKAALPEETKKQSKKQINKAI